MAKLNDETHVLMDGAVKVYRRPNTRRWQATFQKCLWILFGQCDWDTVFETQSMNTLFSATWA